MDRHSYRVYGIDSLGNHRYRQTYSSVTQQAERMFQVQIPPPQKKRFSWNLTPPPILKAKEIEKNLIFHQFRRGASFLLVESHYYIDRHRHYSQTDT